MKRLPLALSLPHAGLQIPLEVQHLSRLTEGEILKDSDEGAREISEALRPHMTAFQDTQIARAFLDLNRPETDLSKDGVVKTHTIWNVPIYTTPPPPEIIRSLIVTYHRPYHTRLRRFAAKPGIRLAVDLHTMAEKAPPIAQNTGTRRPRLCLGNNHHAACPRPWIETLADLAARYFVPEVQINTPFAGGWITQCHGHDMPWIQVEVSREPWISSQEKGEAILEVMRRFVETMTI